MSSYGRLSDDASRRIEKFDARVAVAAG